MFVKLHNKHSCMFFMCLLVPGTILGAGVKTLNKNRKRSYFNGDQILQAGAKQTSKQIKCLMVKCYEKDRKLDEGTGSEEGGASVRWLLRCL